MRQEIKISGIGGQGVVYVANLLGQAASLQYTSVAVSASYGAEARGTITTSGIVVSDQSIDYPHLEQPNCLIAMHQKAYDAFGNNIAPDGIIVVDSFLVKNSSPATNLYLIPATQIAQRELANVTMANLILVGALIKVSKLVTPENIIRAYREMNSSRKVQLGIKALRIGMSYQVVLPQPS